MKLARIAITISGDAAEVDEAVQAIHSQFKSMRAGGVWREE